MQKKEKPLEHATVGDGDPTLKTWHQRFAHQNYAYVRKILKARSIKVIGKPEVCEACDYGKLHRQHHQRSTTKTKRIGELIHADVCAPMEKDSIGGSRYFLLLKDDYSHYHHVYFLKAKSEVYECISN